MTPRPVLPGAVACRAAEIETSLHMSRYHSAPFRRARFAAAVEARIPLPGNPAIAEIARCAAVAELNALAARGVLVLGPDEGPQPMARRGR